MSYWGTWLLLGAVILVQSGRAVEVRQFGGHGQLGNIRRIRADEDDAAMPSEDAPGGKSAPPAENPIVSDVSPMVPDLNTDTPKGKCPIKNVGKHPWIIHFKWDDMDGMTDDFKSKVDEYIKKNMPEGYNMESKSIMQGALISSRTVLTTTAWQPIMSLAQMDTNEFPRYLIIMFGAYNSEMMCRQEQHAKQAIWHPRSNNPEGNVLGNLGSFGLYMIWEEFDVEGEVFLLPKPHPIDKIEETITKLIEKPESLTVFMLSAADMDGKMVDDNGEKFDFIGFPACKEMPNYKKIQPMYVKYDPEVTNTSFFCGLPIPGMENGSMANEAGRGHDGMAGAVAFYEEKTTGNGTMLPLGMYDVYIGADGVPHFYVAFQKIFFDWLDAAEFPPVKTTTLNGDDSGPRFTDSGNAPEPKSKGHFPMPPDFTPPSPPKTAAHSHLPVFWILATSALAAIIFST